MIDTTNAQVAPQVMEQVEEYVAAHWPDLADAQMSVQERKPHQLSNETMSKLNDGSSASIAGAGKDSDSEVREVRPPYVIAPAAPRSANGRTPSPTIVAATAPHYTITLRKNVKTASGTWLPRIARLVVDGSGHILRATASKLFWTFDFRLAHCLLRQGALCYCYNSCGVAIAMQKLVVRVLGRSTVQSASMELRGYAELVPISLGQHQPTPYTT